MQKNVADRMHAVQSAALLVTPAALLEGQGRSRHYHTPARCPGNSALLGKGPGSHTAAHVLKEGSAKAPLSPAFC